ncbi:carbohydrate ABC transporter permease [Marispirochaeta aestuarii]|uniref:carbohydrate ABC transporter permease n=1 Tax=Marispirochaeta aestuarii TaxID=1963862 RepID=UPI0029C78161|nr:carbohydrate ABC transporter permease [Marispirochaeta aestuarii]
MKNKRKTNIKDRLSVWGLHLLAAAVMVPILFPFYWLTVSALQTPETIISIPPKIIPDQLSLHFIYEVFGNLGIGRFLYNSVYLSLLSTFLTVVLASLAAFSYTAYRFKGRVLYSKLVLFVYMFPQILVVIPLYMLLSRAGMINTHFGLVVTYIAFQLPVCIWVLQAYFSTIPRDLMDAATIDGLRKLSTLWYIFLPVALPGLAASAVMTFIGVWNNFLLANTFLIDESLKTLPVIIVDYSSREGALRGPILASSLIVCIPSFIFALFAQKYLVGGLTAGSTKG